MEIDKETLLAIVKVAVNEAMEKHGEELKKLGKDVVEIQAIIREDKGRCPQNCPCQTRINSHDTQLTRTEASAKSAHHRLDSIWKIAGTIGAVAGTAAGAGVSFGYFMYQASHAAPVAAKIATGG